MPKRFFIKFTSSQFYQGLHNFFLCITSGDYVNESVDSEQAADPQLD